MVAAVVACVTGCSHDLNQLMDSGAPPPTSCRSSLDCSSRQVCDTIAGLCVACLTDADCADTAKVCVADSCRTKCVSDKTCTPLGQLCDLATSSCVMCVTSSDCAAGQSCQAGACVSGGTGAGGAGGANSGTGGGAMGTGGAAGSGATGAGGTGGASGTAGAGGAIVCSASFLSTTGGWVTAPAVGGTCWHGYAYNFGDSIGTTATPGLSMTYTSCGAVCPLGATGVLEPSTQANDYGGYVGIGFEVDQPMGAGTSAPTLIPKGSGVTVAFTQSPSTLTLRVQLTDGTTAWCHTVTTSSPATIPYSSFNTKCFDTPVDGTAYAKDPISAVQVVLVGGVTATSYSVGLTSVVENP